MKKYRKPRTIAGQLSLLFIGLLVFVMASLLLVNNAYMARFYELRLRHTLINAYNQVDAHISADQEVDESYFEDEFVTLERSGNISLVVLDLDFYSIFAYQNRDEEVMAARLYAYNFQIDDGDVTIIDTTDNYTFQRKTDEKFHTEYLEMWGRLTQSGYHFMMRIPMESIQTSARISNEFILYTIATAILLGVIMIGWLSTRIARPIHELSELSERMANLDFDAKYTGGGLDEIGQLGEHFNRMSETLEQTISELKTANNELQKNLDEKTRIDDMRREFLSNVSHELKTPLALIQGYAEGLQDCIADDPESRDYYLEVIVDEAEKMNTLVKKLLTLNQLEFGADTVEMVRFDLGELIEGKVNSTKILADQKGAELVYEGPKSIQAWGDEFKVEEVLTNYLSNAINHVDDYQSGHSGAHVSSAVAQDQLQDAEGSGRMIRVRVEKIEETGKIRTSVYNSGSHIPEEDLDQVWDKFFKVDKARTREYGGSGVGLSIVRAIMESFHQEFGVRNVDDGVEFWFELDDGGGEIQEETKEQEWASIDELLESTQTGDRKTRRAGEAAVKEELKRIRQQQKQDDIVDAQWVSADAGSPGSQDGGDTGNTDESEHLQD